MEIKKGEKRMNQLEDTIADLKSKLKAKGKEVVVEEAAPVEDHSV